MPNLELASLVGIMSIGGLTIFAFAGRWGTRMISSLGLLVAMLGAFYLYAVLAPASPTNAGLSIALFAGSAILFRLLSSFESNR